jgi:hypothetical protein
LTKGCEESKIMMNKTMMEDKLDGSRKFKVLERQDIRGRLIVVNTKGFTRDIYQ